MNQSKRPKIVWNQKCAICNVNFSVRDAYVLHLMGKRHQKNVRKRDKSQGNAVRKKRTVCFSGNREKVPLQKIVGYFLDYGVSNVSSGGSTLFIEFETEEAAGTVLRRKTHNIRSLCLRATPMKLPPEREDNKAVRISPSLQRRMSQAVTVHQLHRHIDYLIKEIEMKPWELEERENLLRGISNYLSPFFPKVLGHIFGSSANNLGFTGCDVDIYLDIGVYPWVNCETKAAAQAQGRDITWFLARKIRESGRAIKVEAIPRARVPIVKFQDRSSKIMVDLSFRHGMPVYNTRLISQYTRTHPLVRPYLMVIRYWAKIQDVAGGGNPSHLITNYALTLMMLFYLMHRDDPIIPSLLSLRRRGTYTPVLIGPWDVSFSSEVIEWGRKTHNITVMELVMEFFSFYGNLKASEWVVSPLTGMLLPRKDFEVRSVNLAECFRTYMEQEEDLQVGSELCVQDPFEHTHNCTRGLNKTPFLEFQSKCRIAAGITRGVLTAEQTLQDLFQVYEITPDMIVETQGDSSQAEVISLDESDASQDIQVLEALSEEESKCCHSEETSDVEIINATDTSDIEILYDHRQSDNTNDAKSDLVCSEEYSDGQCVKQSSSSSSSSSSTQPHSSTDNRDDDNSCNSEKVKSDICSEANSSDDNQTIKESINTHQNSSKNGVSDKTKSGGKSDTNQITEQSNTHPDSSKNSESNKTNSHLVCSEGNSGNQIIEQSNTHPHSSTDIAGNSIKSEIVSKPDSGGQITRQDTGKAQPLVVTTLAKLSSFSLDFSLVPAFLVTLDGCITRESKMQDVGVSATTLVEFLLRECLKVEVMKVEDCLTDESRKALFELNKPKLNCNVPAQVSYVRLCKYMCETKLALWKGRKKVAKSLLGHFMLNPLEFEVLITRNQMEQQGLTMHNKIKAFKFTIEVWQEVNDPKAIHVTGISLSEDSKVTQGQMIPMFHYFSSLCVKILKKLSNYLKNNLQRY